MDMLKKVGLGLVLAAAVFGYKFYDKGQTKSATRTQLEQACAADADCLQSVAQHFEGCFDDAYSIGGRRRSSSLDSDSLVGCLNGKAGKPHFSVSAAAE
jgi:hypothetical protein